VLSTSSLLVEEAGEVTLRVAAVLVGSVLERVYP
jgi:hypothetical protein